MERPGLASIVPLIVAMAAGCATTVNDPLTDTHTDMADTTVMDTGSETDPAWDVPADTLLDTAPDTDPDTGVDTVVDTIADTSIDTVTDDPAWDPDVADTGVDSAMDTFVDTGVDTGMDTTVDTGVDTALDSVVDTGADTGTDVPADTLPDASGCTVFGTDSFGYTGCESTPAVSGCDDIRSTGTGLTTGDDEHSRASVGFDFSFYGTTYTDVSVGTNGHVYFVDDYLGLGNVCLPGDPGYSGILAWIAGYWTDLHSGMETSNGIWYQTLGTAPDRRFVVQWDTGYCCSSYGSAVEFTIVLFETTNDIRVCYGNTSVGYGSEDLGAGATAGIQRDLTDALEYSCESAVLGAGLQLDYIHP